MLMTSCFSSFHYRGLKGEKAQLQGSWEELRASSHLLAVNRYDFNENDSVTFGCNSEGTIFFKKNFSFEKVLEFVIISIMSRPDSASL